MSISRCDGRFDCISGGDENNCDTFVNHHENAQCSPDADFTCEKDQLCIPIEDACDGKKDCLDGSDEKPETCKSIANKCKGFLCKNGHCLIDEKWQCDGVNDCGDTSDEQSCRNYLKNKIFNYFFFQFSSFFFVCSTFMQFRYKRISL